MKIKKAGLTLLQLLVVIAILATLGVILFAIATGTAQQPSVSGVEKARANAAVKHLHVISAYSGQVIIHSAVHGDVETFGREIGTTRKPGYLRWCDTNGASHELYVSDRTVIHISSEPLTLKKDNPAAETVPRPEADK